MNLRHSIIKKYLIRMAAVLTAAILAAGIFAAGGVETQASQEDGIPSIDEYVLRPSEAGTLSVNGTQLYGENGQEIVLQGVSLHGLTWYPQYVDQDLFTQVSTDWNANLIRLPVYSEIYSSGKSKQCLELVEKGVEYAQNADMYVLVDWHVLEDKDPNTNLYYALEFFKTVSSKYADCSNVIYEICNEPNGDTTWSDVKEYADIIIPIIRRNDPDSLIMVGTPNYDRDLESAEADPLDYDNIMYSFHFYAASHGQEMQDTLTEALDGGLPVFITECGLSEDSGDGYVDYEEAKTWFSLLHERHISYAVWSLSNKEESSAMIKYTASASGKISQSDITGMGLWVRALMRGENVDAVDTASDSSYNLYHWLRNHKAAAFGIFAAATLILLFLVGICTMAVSKMRRRKKRTYDELIKATGGVNVKDIKPTVRDQKRSKAKVFGKAALLCTTFLTFIYLFWRIMFSMPLEYGWLAIACNIILLLVEILGFAESLVHYYGILHLTKHPLPSIEDSEFPDVDIFVSTYNEPTELLRKTLIGCKHMEYPDRDKVHIYLCDDNRRAEMRALAEELKVNYLDRPDNEGAKAGNLNHALKCSSSPYVVTFDADMIPRREFLIKTIPYFVDAGRRNQELSENERMPLGFIQTPQSFYDPDVFQYNLYDEKHIPNDQDFFYRTIEPAKTYSNSVIYGGSNTILSRKALESIGGFYTKTITEDFATGMLIEAAGFVSLGLSEPLASGMAPSSFKEHVQQRTRWGRGVIRTGRQLKFLFNRNLSVEQKLAYWSSVVYWYSPIKNLIYMLAPLMYGLFGIPVFKCTIVDILVFWLPMFIFQNITLYVLSTGTMSSKWSGIQETSVLPFLLLPVIKESFGVTLSKFKVTDKSGKAAKQKTDYVMMIPFFVLIAMSLAAIVIRIIGFVTAWEFGLLVILFWLVRNVYFLLMSLFLIAGRDSDGENVHVYAAENVTVNDSFPGITSHMTEHGLSVFLDEPSVLQLGNAYKVSIKNEHYDINVTAAVVNIRKSKKADIPSVYTLEITDFGRDKDEYIRLLYDRVSTLPQHYIKEFGILRDLWRNFTKRIVDKS